MSHPKNCPHCRASLPAPRSRLLGYLVVIGAWITVMAMVFGAILLGPAILMVIPFLFAGGASLITIAHAWAFDDWTCDACGKLIEREPSHVPSPSLTPAPAR
jgi:hypothetical protein